MAIYRSVTARIVIVSIHILVVQASAFQNTRNPPNAQLRTLTAHPTVTGKGDGCVLPDVIQFTSYIQYHSTMKKAELQKITTKQMEQRLIP